MLQRAIPSCGQGASFWIETISEEAVEPHAAVFRIGVYVHQTHTCSFDAVP
jgi:hypothetical protein